MPSTRTRRKKSIRSARRSSALPVKRSRAARGKRKTICLNMIVKDEAHVIKRCLDTVIPFIDCWVIVDTGSTDGTQARIRELLARLPGDLHERPWKDFGHNRSEALELARGRADYFLIIDADEEFVVEDGFELPPLSADAYRILHQEGDTSYTHYRPKLVKSSLPWHWVGVLHEYLTCDDAPKLEQRLAGVTIKGHFDSARNRLPPQEKYGRDAQVLEAALRDDPHNVRSVFYLAQSYRDSGQLEKSIECYERRAAMGDWEEEVWYSMFQVGVLNLRLGRFAQGVAALIRAYQYRPWRAESLCELARVYRERKEYHAAILFAERAMHISMSEDVLFADASVYRWRAADEFAVSAYWVGRVKEASRVNKRLLAGDHLPPAQRARIRENIAFCEKALASKSRRTLS